MAGDGPGAGWHKSLRATEGSEESTRATEHVAMRTKRGPSTEPPAPPPRGNRLELRAASARNIPFAALTPRTRRGSSGKRASLPTRSQGRRRGPEASPRGPEQRRRARSPHGASSWPRCGACQLLPACPWPSGKHGADDSAESFGVMLLRAIDEIAFGGSFTSTRTAADTARRSVRRDSPLKSTASGRPKSPSAASSRSASAAAIGCSPS